MGQRRRWLSEVSLNTVLTNLCCFVTLLCISKIQALTNCRAFFLHPARLFGFVARKQGSTTDNVSHLFAELDPDQPASAITSFVSKMMKRWNSPQRPNGSGHFEIFPRHWCLLSPGLDDVLFFLFPLGLSLFPFSRFFFLSAFLICLDLGLFFGRVSIWRIWCGSRVELVYVWCGAANVTNMEAIEGRKFYSQGYLC